MGTPKTPSPTRTEHISVWVTPAFFLRRDSLLLSAPVDVLMP